MDCLNQESGKNWTLYHGDCCEVIKGIPDDSIDFVIHSPPFSTLYIYSDSEADMGNCLNNEEFLRHYEFLIGELYRVTVPGRLCAIHVKDLPLYLNRDGAAGLVDFPGMCIASFESKGWTFHSRVTIWKCPVTERERTNNHGLLHKTILKDSSGVRQGMADYLLVFRKPSGSMVSAKPVERPRGLTRYVGDPQFDPLSSDYHPSPYARTGKPDRDVNGELDPIQSSICIWRRYAEPVWWDIDQTDVLNYKAGRDDKDEKHICPLQMGVIERAIELWTNPGDVVFTPFGGIGSEGVGAIRLGRKAVLVELKESYFVTAGQNLRIAESYIDAPRLDLESAIPNFDDVIDAEYEAVDADPLAELGLTE